MSALNFMMAEFKGGQSVEMTDGRKAVIRYIGRTDVCDIVGYDL